MDRERDYAIKNNFSAAWKIIVFETGLFFSVEVLTKVFVDVIPLLSVSSR